MQHEIYLGDSREVLPELEAKYREKVSLIVTSPPYFVDRGYEDYIDSWCDYWGMLLAVFKACDPLLEPGGKLAINFADRYANYKYFGKSLEIAYLPHYVKIAEHLGYDLWARIIWDKVRVMIDGARHTTNKGRFKGRMRVAPNWEYIFVWRKPGPMENKNTIMSYDEWRKYVDSIWEFSSVSKNPSIENTKLAIFPIDLPARLTKMYCETGDVILDPFVGIGTTVEAARNLGCKGIGIDRNELVLPEIRKTLQPDMFNQDEIKYYNSEMETI